MILSPGAYIARSFSFELVFERTFMSMDGSNDGDSQNSYVNICHHYDIGFNIAPFEKIKHRG